MAQDAAPELRAVPVPDLTGFEPAVRDQLAAAEKELRELQGRDEIAADDLAGAYGRLGQLYHAYELFDAAEACYRNTLALVGDDPRWIYYLGHVHEKRGEAEAALAAYARVLELYPTALPARVRRGRILFTLNRLDEAELELRRALGSTPGGKPAALATLGEIALARGQYGEAVTHLTAALEAVPSANRLHYPLAMAQRGLGNLDAAREHLARQGKVGIGVDDPLVRELERLAQGERVHLIRGQMAFNAGRFQEAADEFLAAVEADPQSAGGHINLGSALARLGETERAIAELRTGVELDPSSISAHYNLGVLLARQGLDEEAAGHLTEAVRRNESDVEARLELAAALRRLGRADDALGHYREAVSRDPHNESAHLGQAAVLIAEERWAEALERLENAHTLLPDAGRIALALARMLAACPDESLRDGERALELARRIYEARPLPEHAVAVAQALGELGRCDEAAEWQGQALDALEAAGDDDRAGALRRDLERYRAGPPCR